MKSLAGFAKHTYLYKKALFTIRDPIYGTIPLTEGAYRIINSSSFQRLKELKQLGPAYLVYPGATHTRLEHSIGVYYLGLQALRHLLERSGEEILHPYLGRVFLAACLLHDIGHLPYGHIVEEIEIGLKHEEMSAYIVSSDTHIKECLKEYWEVEPEDVASFISRRFSSKFVVPMFLQRLLSSTTDLDKMDYLNRDAYHCCVPYGLVDWQRLMQSLLVHEEDLLIDRKGIGPAESIIFAKYLMYRNVYWQHTVRIAATMIKRALLDIHQEIGRLNPEEFSKIDDGNVIQFLKDKAGDKKSRSVCLLDEVKKRKLYKRAYICFPVTEDRFGHQIDIHFGEGRSIERKKLEENLCTLFSKKMGRKLRSFDILLDIPPHLAFLSILAEFASGNLPAKV